MRAILPAVLCAVFTLGAVAPIGAQADAHAARRKTFDQLWALVHPYGSSLHYSVYGMQKDPFTIEAFYDKDLHYAPRLEVYISVTRQKTIQFRVYPQVSGEHINLDSLSQADSLMEKALRFSDKGFFFWAADENLDLFAGYTFTLESGFPDEAIKEVLRSIPLLDASVGELMPYIGE